MASWCGEWQPDGVHDDIPVKKVLTWQRECAVLKMER